MADAVPPGQLPLAGPAPRGDAARLPLRGDLAHVRLAGQYFVAHYAAPLRMRVVQPDMVLRARGDDAAEAICPIATGARFDVLDLAGGWAWGQIDDGPGGHGLVGYVPQTGLDQP